jgi:diaminopimelate epimerase
MPGGDIRIQFENGFFATMTGPVTKVCEGVMAREMFEKALPI